MNKVMKIHAVLHDEYNPVINKLGKSSSGHIVRDFLVPSDMPLWALHYAISTAFGFLNEHLHCFKLYDEDFMKINDNNAGIYRKNIGKWFKSPTRNDEEDFWADDYKSGSFINWRRKKYTGPYIYKGDYPTYESWQDDFNQYLSWAGEKYVIYEIGGKYSFRKVVPLKHFHLKDVEKECVLKFDELPLEIVGDLFEYDFHSLLETITIEEMFNDFKSFKYLYDYGDGWEIDISIFDNVSVEGESIVISTYKPLMVSYDGLNLVEDIGGINGYMDFLFVVFNLKEVDKSYVNQYIEIEGDYYQPIIDINGYEFHNCDISPARMLKWAKSLGWDDNLPPLKKWF